VVYTPTTVWQGYRNASWERLLERGRKRAGEIAEAIAQETGRSLEGRRVLDYGCGVGRLTIPLAERCERAFGVDIVPSVLEEMRANAAREGLDNVEGLAPTRLGELAGRYDLLVSLHVLQHIPRGEGEQLLGRLVRGLAPGGVGYVNLVLRPEHPLRSVLRWSWRSPGTSPPRRNTHPLNPVRWARVLDLSYAYMVRRSYSLDRLGRVLAAEGVGEWHAHFNPGGGGRAFDAVALIFAKD